MTGLVVFVVGDVGVLGQNLVEANDRNQVVGCGGVSRLPRHMTPESA